ncbi:unnamed protein product [Dracunculus medinensis]|uniref:Thiolase_N domain-containing protein n=1 Tax=Dracunculus medinensis TaxID=318479 RepID=A0A3P7TDQ5_DRAME|nr:unnamed protein product [Dracunculus medinensis]
MRTPIANFCSSFKTLSPINLVVPVLNAAFERTRFPKESQCVTVNKVCSSGMKAIIMGVQAIQLGYRNIVVAGGTESMSTTPFYLPREIPFGGTKIADGIQRDGLFDSMVDRPMGYCAEKSVKDFGISRDEQDSYAIESYQKAQKAWKDGLFKNEIVSISISQKGHSVDIHEDEEYNRLNITKVPLLKPVFVENGTITAANASSLSDGAAILIMANGQALIDYVKPIAQILSYAEAGVDPVDFSIAPAIAVEKMLSKTGIAIDQISLWEINEAFAMTALVFIKQLNLNKDRVNIRGGAVALGHPIGASGARIVVTLVHALSSGELGVAAICNGGGEASALLIKKL